MYITAIVGDVHGHHHKMVSMLKSIEEEKDISINAVLQVGDFEAHRHNNDLRTMAAPKKYRRLGDFSEYYEGRNEFPWPIYFIGGNHEPYGWYDQFPDGFKLIKNCQYFGRVGMLEIGGRKVIGISGILHLDKFFSSRPTIDQITYRSNKEYTYYNEKDFEKAIDLGECDILLLHDWPFELLNKKDMDRLKWKNHLNTIIEFGNDYKTLLIEALNPKIIVCGHMHIGFKCTIRNGKSNIKLYCLNHIQSDRDSVILIDDKLEVIFQYLN